MGVRFPKMPLAQHPGMTDALTGNFHGRPHSPFEKVIFMNMNTNFSRRRFLGTAATAMVAGGFSSTMNGVAAESAPVNGWTWQPLLKAMYIPPNNLPNLNDAYCEQLKKAGFDGVMVWNWDTTIEEARTMRLMLEKHDLRYHATVRGWLNTSNPDKEKVAADIKSGEKALCTAAACGGGSVLLVPDQLGGDRIRGMKMPDPWDFEIDFDPKTLKVKTVAAGDNTHYADYIKAQNLATECSIRAVEMLIPTAAKEGVMIGLENVWNNLWCTPEYFAAFVHSFGSPWVKPHFDLGNHTKYSRCEEWLKALGRSIVKLDLKDFAVAEFKGKRGGGPGNWAPIGHGTIDWKNVRRTMEEIRYSGWISVEATAGNQTLEEFSRFIDEYFGA